MKRVLGGLFVLLALTTISCISKTTPKPEFTPIPSGPTPISVIITIDMCQSHKLYEKRLFVYLDDMGAKEKHKIPIAVCVAGGWLNKHQTELKEIIALRNLDITWVNHSLTHPIDNDFLNNPKVNFREEVLGNIAFMKKFGLKPSKYFRFPGLIHNAKRLNELKQMGYISLDADAWLAKRQQIKDGAIVLVHGNGNEPKGIDLLLDYLHKHNQILFKSLPSVR